MKQANLTIKKLLHTLFGLLLTASLGLPVQAEEVMYYHLDALGSAVAATDATGAVLWTESYEPYGERRERSDGGTNSQWFTGKAQDDAIGLNYFGARWYNSRVGRFMAMDPVGFVEENPQSFNRYAYANNNPYRFVDPDGRESREALFEQLGMSDPAAGVRDAARQVANGAATVSDIGDSIATDPTNLIPGGILVGILKKIGGKLVTNDQIKKLSKKEIKRLKNGGEDIHELKGGKDASKRDLFKNDDGDIEVRPKNGDGPGEPTGININDFKRKGS